jgi:hypothetical protein
MSELRHMYKRMQLDLKSTRTVFGILKSLERFSGVEPFHIARKRLASELRSNSANCTRESCNGQQ